MKEKLDRKEHDKKEFQSRRRNPTSSIDPEAAGREIRVTFSLNNDLLNKTKALAKMENTLPKDEINKALYERIKNYEEDNGPLQKLPEEESL